MYPAGSVPVAAACSAIGPTSGFQERLHRREAPEVVLGACPLLLLGERDSEVKVEVTSVRRDPREPPAHAPFVGLEFLERGAGDTHHRYVVMVEVDDETVEGVGDRRAGRAPRVVFRPEHEVVDEQLRASGEELRQRLRPLVGLKGVLLLEPHPRKLQPLPRELVASSRQLLLPLQQLDPRLQPILSRSDRVLHGSYLHLHRRFSVSLGQPSAAPPTIPIAIALRGSGRRVRKT
jgi:hypothetical protein